MRTMPPRWSDRISSAVWPIRRFFLAGFSWHAAINRRIEVKFWWGPPFAVASSAWIRSNTMP